MLTQMNLSKEEIRRLNYERYHYPCPKIQKRLHAVYIKATQSMSNEQTGDIVGIHSNSVSSYIKLYQERGFEGLYATGYHPGKSKLESHAFSLIESFNSRPVCCISEAIARIKELTGIERKPTQVRAFMHRHGFKYRKMASIPGKMDTEKQKNWLEETLSPAIEKAQKGEIELLFTDAAHFTLSAFLCMIWSTVRIFLKTSHGRNRINVLGAVNAITKQVTTLINTTYITAETIICFLLQLKETYANKPIFLVLDNARYQHCNAVKQKAGELGITLLFLPAYSPNLNIIERLWKFTKKQILYAKYFDSAEIFHQTVKDFFSDINDKHKHDLEKLMTLNFQLFDNINSQKHAA
jgi:transposase